MSYEIYWITGSPYSWRAQLGLEIKGVDYDSRLLQSSKGEHKTLDYLKMNPRGKVPVLKDGDTIIYESMAILAYLDRKHPEPPLFGTTPEETGYVWQTIFEIENYVLGHVLGVVIPVFFGTASENAEAMQKSAKLAHEEFKGIETKLSSTNYLAGENISAADVALFPVIQALLRALSLEAAPSDFGFLPLAQHYPGIAAWIARIEAIPGYDNTFPPNWRE